MTDRKMQLGPRLDGWAPWSPQRPTQWPIDYGQLNRRYWSKPFDRYFERLGYRRYKAAPHPWAPGRYCTSKWQAWSGYGKFSGLPEMLRHQYFAERYTGIRLDPQDYRHHSLGPITPEETARRAAYREEQRRKYSWRFDPPAA